jgi:hypothetical protein
MRPIQIFLVAIVVFMAGCPSDGIMPTPLPAETSQSVSHEVHAIPEDSLEEHPEAIEPETRPYYIGVVPSPKTRPSASFDGVIDAYREAGELGEVTMVWTDPNCIGQCGKLRQNRVVEAVRNNGMEPILTLSFATITEVRGEGLQYTVCWPNHEDAGLDDPAFREAWVAESRFLAEEFQPGYFSLGNEVNDYFYLHPEDLDSYLSLYDEAYSEIKKVSPDTKVFVVFSYTHLVENGQWELIEKFNVRSDLIGLTTYPWKQYETPEEIPQDYYLRIMEYTDKPIAFTEIGWPSTNSESEQAEFLGVFLERTDGMDIEMINWLFLHEITLEGTLSSITEEETQSIALKAKDGAEKQIYAKWKELSEKKIRP